MASQPRRQDWGNRLGLYKQMPTLLVSVIFGLFFIFLRDLEKHT
jgi:hypothetical protein